MVQVTADADDISSKSDSFFHSFDLVVATNCSSDQLVGLQIKKKNLTCRDGTVVRALASHQCDPGSIPSSWVM